MEVRIFKIVVTLVIIIMGKSDADHNNPDSADHHQSVNCNDCILTPGLVDLHTHLYQVDIFCKLSHTNLLLQIYLKILAPYSTFLS